MQNVRAILVVKDKILFKKLAIQVYEITEILHLLSLVDRCVKMRVCKHHISQDILDFYVFLRNI